MSERGRPRGCGGAAHPPEVTPHSPLQGMSIAVLGPTFPTLAANVGKNVSDIYYIFVGRSLGSLGGSVVGGVLFDCMNATLLLGECCLALPDTVRGNFCFSAASAAPGRCGAEPREREGPWDVVLFPQMPAAVAMWPCPAGGTASGGRRRGNWDRTDKICMDRPVARSEKNNWAFSSLHQVMGTV